MLPNSSGPFNYKFVIDNIDKNVKPSFQRSEFDGKSFHHVHGYSVQDRVNTSVLRDRVPQFRKADPVVMLPSRAEIAAVKDEMVIFVSRYVSVAI